MTDGLQARLLELADHVDWSTTDVASQLGPRLRAPSPRSRLARSVTAALFVAIVALVLAPAGRKVVADVLGVVGIDVRWGEVAPGEGESGSSEFGPQVPLNSAIAAVDFPVLVPSVDPPGLPDIVHLHAGEITGVWESSGSHPAIAGTDTAILHTQFRGTLDREVLTKRLGEDTTVTEVSFRGTVGLWIEGGRHVVTRVGPDGLEQPETTRLAGNVLLWEESGVTHRVESALALDRVTAIVESMAPLR